MRVGPRPGQPVTVVVRVGDIEAFRSAHACRRLMGRLRALPGGKRVEGRFTDGHIEVSAP